MAGKQPAGGSGDSSLAGSPWPVLPIPLSLAIPNQSRREPPQPRPRQHRLLLPVIPASERESIPLPLYSPLTRSPARPEPRVYPERSRREGRPTVGLCDILQQLCPTTLKANRNRN